MAKVLSINAKCSDMCFSELIVDGVSLGEISDYAPRVKGIGGGDYVAFQVDLETGQILNWQKPSEADLQELKEKYAGESEE